MAETPYFRHFRKTPPRSIRPYPKRKVTGIHREARDAVKGPLTRIKRPRRHARPWKWRTRQDPQKALEARAHQGVFGSLQERILYKALVQRGLRPGEDFTFQSSQLGGRAELGGIVADFMFPISKVVIQVQSVWHTMTAELMRRDEDQAAILNSFGFTVLEIWPTDIEDQARLDAWLDRNVMQLWGVSSQGRGYGGANELGYLDKLSLETLVRIEQKLDILIEITPDYFGFVFLK